MISYTDTTVMALWYMSARRAEESGSESFFVDDKQDLFLFFDIFFDTFLNHFAKITMLTSHIDEIDVLFLFWMGEEFVIHK
jgi:hypothetical protein